MDDKILQSLILLTYKGKVLLMHKTNSPIDKEKHPWCLIGAIKDKKESFENAMSRRVEKETGIKIEKVEFVSKSCYHARLTDDNVNKMERAENQLLYFFTLKELKKLFLSNTTAQFISKHSALI
ncbi:MAG: NUDIX domain-containing protein [Candidatus Levybacteria bacterium]|nr:NUDIX domain-containing protein [Candidatus Levybacteria bacterium]